MAQKQKTSKNEGYVSANWWGHAKAFSLHSLLACKVEKSSLFLLAISYCVTRIKLTTIFFVQHRQKDANQMQNVPIKTFFFFFLCVWGNGTLH